LGREDPLRYPLPEPQYPPLPKIGAAGVEGLADTARVPEEECGVGNAGKEPFKHVTASKEMEGPNEGLSKLWLRKSSQGCRAVKRGASIKVICCCDADGLVRTIACPSGKAA